MTRLTSPLKFALLLGAALVTAAALAEPAASDAEAPAAKASSEWTLERVVLNDGRTFQGLVESESPANIEFVEVHRPRGKPMFLVVRPIERKTIASLERLTPEEQHALRTRLEKYKQRALIESRRMEDFPLSAERSGDKQLWKYQGQWFSLESTADEAMTRRAIIRVEQIFTAYRQFFPPQFTNRGHLDIKLYGESKEYREALKQQGLAIRNPAVYLADSNTILAGTDLNRFNAELALVTRQHQQIRQELDSLATTVVGRTKELGEELKKAELPAAERQKIVMAETKKWDDQRKAARRKITTLERKNAARFNEVAGTMFTRLSHEAFHAYLETYVYPRQSFDMPRWLNEGLAQTFEAGLLEADTLRVDMPNRVALAELQSDLRGPQPLELSQLLNAGADTFLSAHAGNGAIASRNYHYSWGLAHYLVFEQGVLGTPEFAAYLSPAEAARPAVERFEKLVGMPLDKFQTRWRKAMLELDTGP